MREKSQSLEGAQNKVKELERKNEELDEQLIAMSANVTELKDEKDERKE